MPNKALLDKRIAESGYKKSYIAKVLGITPETFSRKVGNISCFNISETRILCELLGINTPDEKDAIFFAEE